MSAVFYLLALISFSARISCAAINPHGPGRTFTALEYNGKPLVHLGPRADYNALLYRASGIGLNLQLVAHETTNGGPGLAAFQLEHVDPAGATTVIRLPDVHWDQRKYSLVVEAPGSPVSKIQIEYPTGRMIFPFNDFDSARISRSPVALDPSPSDIRPLMRNFLPPLFSEIKDVSETIRAFRDGKNNFGSSSRRVGDFQWILDRIKHAGENFEAQMLFVA